MVAINSTMLVLYGVLGGWLLGVNKMPVPWQALLLSIGIYVALPLVAGYFSRKWIIALRASIGFRIDFTSFDAGVHYCCWGRWCCCSASRAKPFWIIPNNFTDRYSFVYSDGPDFPR